MSLSDNTPRKTPAQWTRIQEIIARRMAAGGFANRTDARVRGAKVKR